ncbi:hypothetical protein Tco_0928885, partial [Tanacetum coccineum]
INLITTRSGLTTAEPSIPPHVPPTPREEVEKELETLMDEVHITSPASTVHVPPLGIQPVSPPKPKEDPKPNPHQPKVPYPSRLDKTKLLDKNDVQVSKFLKILKQLHFDISLMYVLTQIPKYHKVLKDLLKDKEKLEELANRPINVECSVNFLNKVPKKLGDPKKFLIPCILQDLEKLGIGSLKPTRMTLELANRSVALPKGIAQDVIVRVDKFNFLADFVVVNFEVDLRVPIILGDLSCALQKLLNNLSDIQSSHCINVIDFLKDKPISDSTTSPSDSFPSSLLDETSDSSLEEFVDELALLEPFSPRNEDDNFDLEVDLREIEYLLNRDPSTNYSPKTNIDIIDLILKGYTDEPALVYSFPPGDDDDDLFDFKSDNGEWKKLFDSTLSKESSEIATLLSSPFENEDKVFNPRILILGGTQIFHEESKDKDLKMNSSTEALLILVENNFLSHSSDRSSDRELLFFLESTVIETLLSFLFENEDKVFNPGILISNRVHYIPLDLSHRSGTFICINVYLNILNESLMEIFLSTCFSPNITMIWGESS